MALARWLGAPADDKTLWRAWEPVLFNQTHDLASGVMTDHVYEDVLRGYDLAKQISDELIAARWESIAAHIDTRGVGIPIVVFNTLGWPRTDVAEVEVGFDEPGVLDLDLLDPLGHETAVQVLRADRYGAAGIQQARICFVAREVPALGYATYRVVPRQTTRAEAKSERAVTNSNSIENEFYRITFNRAGGEITGLLDKSQQWEALSGPANVVSREQDKGDLWELYHGLDGGSHIAMTNRQAVPKPGAALFSAAYPDAAGSLRQGPVFSEFEVSHPFATGTFATRVRLSAGLRRIDFETTLSNNEKYVRYQVLFPTSIQNGRYFQEIPFGAVERPLGIEYPAQQWVDYSDGQRGVALLNMGLPGNLVSDNTLMLSLLRSHNLGAYGFGGGYEPGMSSESGFELGRTHTFRYALLPHAGDWREAAVYREGLAFNHPLLVHKAALHAGSLPARWGLLEISHPNVVLTAFKPGPGKTTILRVYEAGGRAAPDVRISLRARITAANEANLLEDSRRKLNVRNNTVQFSLHPFEIKTIQLQLADARR